MTTDELIKDLRDHARIHWNGEMGSECVVDKSLLSEAADRLEELSSVKFCEKYLGVKLRWYQKILLSTMGAGRRRNMLPMWEHLHNLLCGVNESHGK